MFEIMFDDLKPEAQERFLKYMGLNDASEGNYEFFPITTIEYNDDETSAEASSGNIYESLNLTVAPGDIEISEDDKDHAILRHNCFLEVPAYRWYSAEKVYLSFVGDMDEVLGRPYAMIELWDVEEQYDNGNLGIHRHQPI